MEGSERVVILVCGACGQRTVLGEPLSVWRSESTTFGCECGEQLTLADRLDSEGFNRVTAEAPASSLSSWRIHGKKKERPRVSALQG
jgi:hypothetical protein